MNNSMALTIQDRALDYSPEQPDRSFKGRMIITVMSITLTIALAVCLCSPVLAAKSGVYTVSGYPVEAKAKNAVTAKKLALEDGQLRAFRSLLKRIVPVSDYSRLPKLKLVLVQDLIEGFSVRNERISSTEYLATLEFKFRQRNIQQLLKSYGLPYVDVQAPKIIVVPHYVGSWSGADASVTTAAQAVGGFTQDIAPDIKARQKAWKRAWKDLDLSHALVPVQLKDMHEKIHSDTVRDLIAGKTEAFKIVREEYDAKRILVALAGSDAKGQLAVRFIGADAIGKINLARTYRIYDGDFLYAAELASYIGLGVLEGRWKSVKARKVAFSATKQWGVQQAVRAEVQFSGLYEWQQIRQKLAKTPEIDELKIGRLSARGADVTLNYSGEVSRLRAALRVKRPDIGGARGAV